MWKLVLLTGAATAAFALGWRIDEWRHGAADAAAARAVVRTVAAQGAISVSAAAADAKAQARIHTVTRTLTREIPVHVSAQTDADFAVPVGLVRVHDAAALGLDVSAVPDPAGRADGAASGVAPSDLGRAIIGNYGECRADQARLSALQDWLEAQAKVAGASMPGTPD